MRHLDVKGEEKGPLSYSSKSVIGTPFGRDASRIAKSRRNSTNRRVHAEIGEERRDSQRMAIMGTCLLCATLRSSPISA